MDGLYSRVSVIPGRPRFREDRLREPETMS